MRTSITDLIAFHRCAKLRTIVDVSTHHLFLTTMFSMPSFAARADIRSALGLRHIAKLSTLQRAASHSSTPPNIPLKAPPPYSPPAPRSRGPNAKGSGHSRSRWQSAALLLPPALAALLGKWQLDRRQWKIDMLNRRQGMLALPPLDISSSDSEPKWTELEEYRPVTATGHYDEDRTQFIGPRPRTQMGTTEVGYLVVTPLVLPSKQHPGQHGLGKPPLCTYSEVMVLRGWAPAAWREAMVNGNRHDSSESTRQLVHKKKKEVGAPSAVSIQGVLRRGEDPGTFVPENSVEQKTFYYVNPGELAMAAGLPETTPLVELVTPEQSLRMVHPGGPPTAMEVLGGRGTVGRPAVEELYPLPKSAGDMMAFSVMPRDHANYAATWFTLSGATTLLAVRALRRSGR